MTPTVWRFRLAAVCLLLTTFAFLQSPGRVAADTKLDLTANPVGLLERGLTLWDPQGFFGQIQNQAYGYLFPMGPFHALGHLLAVPEWAVQRLWWSLLLCSAFLGMVTLTSLLVGSRSSAVSSHPPGTRAAAVVAGLVYALAPRMVSTIGPISAEALPMAVAPWVLVPLVLAQGGASARRMAALSGLAVLCLGAVNAVATVAVLPLAVWWLATRRPFPRRLAAWWVASVGLATMWWLVPLLLLGQYAPPFLDWIESASVTTRPTGIDTVLRGTSHWVAYVVEAGGPVWPAGYSMVSQPLVVAATALVAGVGLAGLARRRVPEGAFLRGAVAIGVVMVSAGHTGLIDGLVAAQVQDFLDGVLAPLRNVHKGDPVLRLPLAIGAGLLAGHLWSSSRDARGRGLQRTAVVLTVATMGVASVPLWSGSLTAGRTYEAIPGYWQETADWLAERGEGRALVVPGSTFGIYIWGRTQDEPLQPLARSPWAVRDAVPLSSAGNIRLLDAIDTALASGRGSPALAEVLARSGVQWLVVRNDLAAQAVPPRSVLVHQGLARSPGLVLRQEFGPILPPFRTAGEVVDDGLQEAYAAVEVWQVRGATAVPVRLTPAQDLLTVAGAPESRLPQAESGVLGGRPTVLASTEDGPRDEVVLTDSFRRTEVNFGRVRDNRSETLTADDGFVLDRGVRDYYPVSPDGRQAVAVEDGFAVRASSSGSAVDALRGRAPSSQPWSAVDGDPDTFWVSGDLSPGVGQWWEIRWDEPRPMTRIGVRLLVGGIAGAAPASVTVTTDRGSLESAVLPTDVRQLVDTPDGSTRFLRITLTEVEDGSAGDAFGLAEVDVGPTDVTRPVAVPGTGSAQPPAAVILSARSGERYGCVHLDSQVQCSRSLPVAGEERRGIDRLITLDEAGEYRVAVTVRPRPGVGLDRILGSPTGRTRVSASSQLVSDPLSGPAAAVDADLRTAWYADPLDDRPSLRLAYPNPVRVTGLTIDDVPTRAASRPLSATVRSGREERQGFVGIDGRLDFPAITGRVFDVEFGVTSALVSRDPTTGATAEMPLAIGELELVGAEAATAAVRSLSSVGVACGFGPRLMVNGSEAVNTLVSASAAAVRGTELMPATPCDRETLRLDQGTNRITVLATEEFLVDRVDLVRIDAPAGGIPREQPTVVDWQATERVVAVPESDQPRLLETTENANVGWQASLDGQALPPIVVDGWRQAWQVPADTGGLVTIVYGPQRWYTLALVIGAVAVCVLAVAAAWPASRLSAPTAGATYTWPLASTLVLVVSLSTAGVVGAAVACVAALVVRRRPRLSGWLLAAGWGTSALVATIWTWPAAQSAPAPVEVAAALGALVALVVVLAVAED